MLCYPYPISEVPRWGVPTIWCVIFRLQGRRKFTSTFTVKVLAFQKNKFKVN